MQRVTTIATAPNRNASGADSQPLTVARMAPTRIANASGARSRRLASPANGTSIRKPWCAARSAKREG